MTKEKEIKRARFKTLVV